MSPRKRFSRAPEPSCDRLREGDGLDPRFDRRDSSRIHNRKALQLCEVVAQTLNSVLQGESGDACLRDLLVEAVIPFPTSVRLLVTVALLPTAETQDTAIVLAHLERAKGRLRSELAAALSRRRTPDLVFRVRTPGLTTD